MRMHCWFLALERLLPAFKESKKSEANRLLGAGLLAVDQS
jgi:hypothetical protein